jgi:opacity protein-like surface antigen
MKKLVLIAVFLLGFSLVSVAQDNPAAEIYLGYAYSRCDTQGSDESCNLNGWDGSVSLNPNNKVGVVIDFGGYYGKIGDELDANIHSVMIGPKVTFRKERVTPFVQALIGYGHVNVKEGPSIVLKENDFAMAFGGGLDVNLTDILAVRPVQMDYFVIKSGSEMLDNFRYSGGIVFKLGNR